MEAQGDCETWWRQENSAIVRRWQGSAPGSGTRRRCHTELLLLLRKLQGLPAEPRSAPLELTVLGNLLLAHSNGAGGGFLAEQPAVLESSLHRVMAASGQGVGLWGKVLAADHSLETTCALNRLAGLQAALWMSNGRLQEAADLFSLLTQTPDRHSCSHKEDDLLLLIKAWKVTPEEPEGPLALQTASHLKDVLYNAAALLQGISAMNASDFPRAVVLLQEAASSLCSSRVLAEIYTCLGCSFYKMAKPQMSLQCWRMALRTDFRCLSALYHSSVLYRDVGDAESELQALALLHAALEHPKAEDSIREPPFPFRTELIVSSLVLGGFIHTPSSCEVKYLMARRCLRDGSIEQAVGHYLQLMSALQDAAPQQGSCASPAPLPRIPIIYLEASAALVEDKRFQDAITMCSEVLEHLGHLTSGVICINSLRSEHEKAESMMEQLSCVLWASSAHLLQGEAHGMLGNHRESIADFTRSINLLSKVQCDDPGSIDFMEYKVCGILKAAAFLWRSHQFQQMGEDVKALINAQLSVQVAPAFPGATLCLLDALWRLGRKKEAACQWRRFQSNKENGHQQWEVIRGDLPLYLSLIWKKDSMDPALLKELEDYTQNEN